MLCVICRNIINNIYFEIVLDLKKKQDGLCAVHRNSIFPVYLA